jgi:integrase
MLYIDFNYRNTRCREQTALKDTKENRKRVKSLLDRILNEIELGTFDYATTFPGSPKAKKFAASANQTTPASSESDEHKPDNQSAAFSDFAALWQIEMSPQWKRSHRMGVEDILAKNLLPVFGQKPIHSITKADVLSFRATLSTLPGRKGTLSASRINKIMCILRQILNEASDRFNFASAFRGVKPLKQKRPDVHPFTLDEVRLLIESVRTDYRHYLTIRFFTAMRTCEINGLKWKCVDFDSNLILVRETFVAGHEEIGGKTEQSVRDIPMQPMVREAMETLYKTRIPGCEWVFANASGNPVDAKNFTNRVWYPLLRYLNLDKRRPYQTRHTAATLMLAAGENPEWIARVMGHVDTTMLFKVYSRFVPNLTRQDGQAMAGLINRRWGENIPESEKSKGPIEPTQLLQALTPDQQNMLLDLLKSASAA